MTEVLADAGPLVALLNARDDHHEWARTQWEAATRPWVTCEAVLAEVCWLLRRLEGGPRAVMALVERGALSVEFDLAGEARPVGDLLRRFADVPMSLADACLVRMTELKRDSTVLTLDSDFRVYRRLGRRVVPTVFPERR